MQLYDRQKNLTDAKRSRPCLVLRVLITDDGGFTKTAINPLDRVFEPGRAGEIVIGSATSVQDGVVNLEDGRQLRYDYLVLATGTSWGGPLAFPKNVEDKDKWITEWREKFRKANDIVILGGGAVGIGKLSFFLFFSFSQTSTRRLTVSSTVVACRAGRRAQALLPEQERHPRSERPAPLEQYIPRQVPDSSRGEVEELGRQCRYW